MPADLGWRDAAARGLGSGVQPPVPDGDNQIRVAGGQDAGEMDCASAPEGMIAGELASTAFDRGREPSRPDTQLASSYSLRDRWHTDAFLWPGCYRAAPAASAAAI